MKPNTPEYEPRRRPSGVRRLGLALITLASPAAALLALAGVIKPVTPATGTYVPPTTSVVASDARIGNKPVARTILPGRGPAPTGLTVGRYAPGACGQMVVVPAQNGVEFTVMLSPNASERQYTGQTDTLSVWASRAEQADPSLAVQTPNKGVEVEAWESAGALGLNGVATTQKSSFTQDGDSAEHRRKAERDTRYTGPDSLTEAGDYVLPGGTQGATTVRLTYQGKDARGNATTSTGVVQVLRERTAGGNSLGLVVAEANSAALNPRPQEFRTAGTRCPGSGLNQSASR